MINEKDQNIFLSQQYYPWRPLRNAGGKRQTKFGVSRAAYVTNQYQFFDFPVAHFFYFELNVVQLNFAVFAREFAVVIDEQAGECGVVFLLREFEMELAVNFFDSHAAFDEEFIFFGAADGLVGQVNFAQYFPENIV